MREVGEQCLAPFILVDACADVAVEVAIRAFADAERPVDVEGQISPSRLREGVGGWERGANDGATPSPSRERGGRAHSCSAATSLRNASARGVILCFESGSTFPKVSSKTTST